MAALPDSASPVPAGDGRRPSSGGSAPIQPEGVAPVGMPAEDQGSLDTDPPAPAGGAVSKVKVVARSDDPMIGTTIAGRYKIEARLGEGGMGAVYRVEHTHMRKKLALKVLHREMTTQKEIVARFEREAMAAAHIDHPNVAGATDFGKLEDGSCYLVLEYVEGPSLRSQIDRGPLKIERALHITRQILSGLRSAHELGIVHRDLKPENILLVDKDGDPDFVKILDFGIARVPIGSLGGESGDHGPSLTRAGMVYGTPEYMAPEQALGQAVDGRSDIYGAGVMLFEMITGKRPYDNKDKVALLGQHVAGPIPSLRERAKVPIPDGLEAVVTKLLAKSPADRYEDGAAAVEALSFLEGMDVVSSGSGSSADRSGDFIGHVSAPAIEFVRGMEDTGPNSSASGPRPALSNAAPSNQPAGDLEAVSPKRQPTTTFAILALAAAVVLAVIVVVAMRRTGTEEERETRRISSHVPGASAAGGSTSPAASGGATVSPRPVLGSTEVKMASDAALKIVSSGDWEGGMAKLKALVDENPSEPDALRAYAVGLSKTKKHVDALVTVKKLVTISPLAASDPDIGKVFDDALASPAAVESAFSLLETAMGGEGAKILYDVAYGTRAHVQAARARKSLADPEVQKNLPPSIRAAIDLRNAPNCQAKKEVITKAHADFDARALPLLKQLTPTSGCGGFFKKQDCWPCLHEKGYLDSVIKEVEERTKK